MRFSSHSESSELFEETVFSGRRVKQTSRFFRKRTDRQFKFPVPSVSSWITHAQATSDRWLRLAYAVIELYKADRKKTIMRSQSSTLPKKQEHHEPH